MTLYLAAIQCEPIWFIGIVFDGISLAKHTHNVRLKKRNERSCVHCYNFPYCLLLMTNEILRENLTFSYSKGNFLHFKKIGRLTHGLINAKSEQKSVISSWFSCTILQNHKLIKPYWKRTQNDSCLLRDKQKRNPNDSMWKNGYLLTVKTSRRHRREIESAGGAGEKETGNGDIKIAHYSAHSLRYQHVTQFYRITFPARVYPLNVEQCLWSECDSCAGQQTVAKLRGLRTLFRRCVWFAFSFDFEMGIMDATLRHCCFGILNGSSGKH